MESGLSLKDIVGGALAVVAPPLGAFASVVAPLARVAFLAPPSVGGVILRTEPLLSSQITQGWLPKFLCVYVQMSPYQKSLAQLL